MNLARFDPRRWTPERRRAARLSLFLLTTLIAWAVLSRFMANRSLDLTLHVKGCGPAWSVRWTGPDHEENGSWLDLASAGATELMEVLPSGKPTDPTKTFRFWFYRARAFGAAKEQQLDLKSLLHNSHTEKAGRWVDFESGPGVIYAGNAPGQLWVPVPTGTVHLDYAMTNDGGPVTIRFGGDEKVIDCYSPGPGQGGAITLTRQAPQQDSPLSLHVRMPRYTISAMRLAWDASPGGSMTIDRAVVRWRVFGLEVRRTALLVGPDLSSAPGFVTTVTTAPGSLPIAPPPGLGPLGHLVGIAVTAAALGAFLALARLIFLLVVAGPSIRLASVSAAVAVRLSRLSTAIRASSIGHSRWASPFVIACAVAAAARIWMCTWAPMLYPPDAMDYIRETTNFLATGHLENTGIRVLGISVYFAPFWKLFSDFNFALGIGNAVLGWLTAVLAGLIARRLMPRPIDAIVVAVVGLSPLLLAWERAAMSESPAAFISTLMFWLALRPGRWSVSEGRLAIAIPVAILMGLMIVAGAYVRLNMQILAAFVPAAVLAAAWPNRGFRKALLLATLIAGTAFAGFLPRMNSIRHDYNRFAFAVGTEYAAGMLGWYSGLVDVNQTRVTDFATTRELLAELNGDGTTYGYQKRMLESKTIPGPPYKNGITDVSERYGYVLRESTARLGDHRLIMAFVQWAHLMGFWTRHGFSENEYWTSPLRGIELTAAGPQNYFEKTTTEHAGFSKEAYDRTHRDIGPIIHGLNAAFFGHFFGIDIWLRPVWASLFMIGGLGALFRRDWCMTVLAALVALHALALAYTVMSWIDRYCVPFDPLLRLTAIYGIWCMCVWLTSRTPSSPQSTDQVTTQPWRLPTRQTIPSPLHSSV